MQLSWRLTFLLFVSVVGTAAADSDCTEEAFYGDDCCNMVGKTAVYKRENMEKCVEKHVLRNPPRNSSEIKSARTCTIECILSEEGLLTKENKLDKPAIIKFFTPFNADFEPIVRANIEKCFDTYEADVDPSLKCKSGGCEFHKCLFRESFLNCPSALWTASSDCDELKVNVTKCPKVPVVVGVGQMKITL